MSVEKRPSSLYLDLKSLGELFREVDKEEKGYIEFEGLQEMISNMNEFDPSMAKELMEKLDRDRDGKVTLEDFQTLYTVEREAIKEQQPASKAFPGNVSSDKLSVNISSDKASVNSPFTSPNLLTRVPDSPDLASHARSLRGTVYGHNDSSFQYNLVPSSGDIVLEDSGDIGSANEIPAAVTSPRPHSFYHEIRKELEQICPNGIVEQGHVLKLSNALGLDAPDEQELLETWEECEGQLVTVDSMCRLLQEKEKIALISSVPSKLNTKEAWQTESPSTESPLVLKDPPKSSTPYKKLADVAEDIDCFDEDTGGSDNEWISGTSYNFYDTPRKRPSSAREGLRLSRGYSESGLRQTAIMHSEYKLLQEKLVQAMSENDSLKSNFTRVEEEKKKLIVEGEESIQQLHKIKQDEMNAMRDDYSMKLKEMEKSFTGERHQLHEKAEQLVTDYKEQLTNLKDENKNLRNDLEYFKNDNTKLVEDLQSMRSEIKEKENRIARLHETFGIQMESPSDTDLEMQANRLQELEQDLNDYIQVNEDLRAMNRELSDKVDELKEECEEQKMKLIEEKRKRQRRKSNAMSLPTSRTSSSSTLQTKRIKRDLPEIPPHRGRQHEEPDSGVSRHTMYGSEEDSMREHETSDDSDEFKTVSSASLLEEIRIEDSKQQYMKKMSELGAEKSQLEKNIKELQEENSSMKAETLKLQRLLEQSQEDKFNLESELAQVKEDNEETLSSYVIQMDDMKMENESLHRELEQKDLEFRSKLLLAQNHSEEMEEKVSEITRSRKQLEGKLQSMEYQLKVKTNETGLAIHDLMKKEEDYTTLEDKMEKMKDELSDLRATIVTYESKIEASKQEKTREVYIEPAAQDQTPSKRRITATPICSPIPLLSSSPLPLSPTNKSISSAEGQSDIVSQMKLQLEDLQKLLVNKSGQDTSDTEMTVIQELLEMNNALEESIASQQRWYNSEMAERDSLIEDLQRLLVFLKSHITENCSKIIGQTTENLQIVPELIQAMCERIASLTTNVEMKLDGMSYSQEDGEMVSFRIDQERGEERSNSDDHQRIIELQGLLEKSTNELKEGEEKRLELEVIIKRQRNELKFINHQLGKAKTLEVQQNKEKEEREKELREKDTNLQNKQIELMQLRETVEKFQTSSMPSLHLAQVKERGEEERGRTGSTESGSTGGEEDELDVLQSSLQKQFGVTLVEEVRGEIQRMSEEMKTHRKSTATAEDLLSQLRKELHNLYHEIATAEKPETMIDDIAIINGIREAFNGLQQELSMERELHQESREDLTRKTAECEQIYSEHEEEVEALKQRTAQNEQYLVSLFTSKDNEVREYTKASCIKSLLKMAEEVEELRQTKALLEEALHNSLTSITKLQTERVILIETIQRLSLQTLHALKNR